MIISTVIINWINYCKVFWWFYCVNTKYIVYVWLCFLVFIIYFQLLFELILEVCLMILVNNECCSSFFLLRGINFILQQLFTPAAIVNMYFNFHIDLQFLQLLCFVLNIYVVCHIDCQFRHLICCFKYLLKTLSNLWGWYFFISVIKTVWWWT